MGPDWVVQGGCVRSSEGRLAQIKGALSQAFGLESGAVEDGSAPCAEGTEDESGCPGDLGGSSRSERRGRI